MKQISNKEYEEREEVRRRLSADEIVDSCTI
jgi:hypothetical protein